MTAAAEHPTPIRAILFDVGGPLDTEEQSERYIDGKIRESLAEAGIAVSAEEYAAANEWAVASFAPDTYAAIIWRLCAGRVDLASRIREQGFPGRAFQMREGMAGIIQGLAARGLLLGLAANQPANVLGELDRFGIGEHFTPREVSGHHGFRKPDVRLFLRACDDLGVVPEECIMVGDRIDNDIAPARMLGMRTVLFRTGRHALQQPRWWREVPDAEVRTTGDLTTALDLLLGS